MCRSACYQVTCSVVDQIVSYPNRAFRLLACLLTYLLAYLLACLLTCLLAYLLACLLSGTDGLNLD